MSSTEGHAMEGNAVEAERDTLAMRDEPSTSKTADVGVVPSPAKELNGVDFSKTVQAKLEGCKDTVKCNVRRASDRKIIHKRAYKIKRGQKILNAAMKTINSLPNVEEEQKKSPDVETPKKTSNTKRKASSDGAKSTQSAAPQKANKRALPVRKAKTVFRFSRKNSRSKNTNVARSESYFSSASDRSASDRSASDCSSQDQRKRPVAKSRRTGPPAKRKQLGKVVEPRSECTSGRSSDSGCSDCGFSGYGRRGRRKKRKIKKKKKPCRC